ncbi:MAG TPA: hypothetical protein VJ644_05025 [Jiangellaceae bacterium]|nr:hypothetical protein [Jiangellaceae bacterium]
MVSCLDNASDIQPWLQDAIYRAVTGDGLLRRQLCTDSDVSVLAFRRVVVLTSIDPGRLGGDLADRLLNFELERIPDDARVAEKVLTARWAAIHAGVLGGLLHTAVNVLKAMGGIRTTGLPRMADFARVLFAVDQVLGTDGFTTYSEPASRTAETVVECDSVAVAIRETIKRPWQGTASDLLKLLTADRQGLAVDAAGPVVVDEVVGVGALWPAPRVVTRCCSRSMTPFRRPLSLCQWARGPPEGAP